MTAPGRDRSRLHLSKLDAFAEWAATQGYEREPTKGYYEVLRLRRKGEPPHIFHRHEGGDHATTIKGSTYLVTRWLRDKRRAAEAAATEAQWQK